MCIELALQVICHAAYASMRLCVDVARGLVGWFYARPRVVGCCVVGHHECSRAAKTYRPTMGTGACVRPFLQVYLNMAECGRGVSV